MAAVLVVVVIVVAALVGAAVTFIVAPPGIALTAAVAVYGSVLSTLAVAAAARQALRDRPGLDFDAQVQPFGPGGPSVVAVWLVNRGRRPVRVEDVGFWPDRTSEVGFPSWWTWRDARQVFPLPLTLDEAGSQVLVAYPGQVAYWYACHEPPEMVFVRPSVGKAKWARLSDPVRTVLRDAWPDAQARLHEELYLAEKADLDDYGQPPSVPHVAP